MTEKDVADQSKSKVFYQNVREKKYFIFKYISVWGKLILGRGKSVTWFDL